MIKRVWFGTTAVCTMLFITLVCNLPALSAAAVDVTTQHNDNRRTGANLAETKLNAMNVNKQQFGKLFSKQVDGQIYAQPLYLSNMNVNGKVRNVLYIATMHNTLYCFDADDPSAEALWSVSFGPSVPLPDVNIGWGVYYGDIRKEIGILSTPVIDRASNTIYLVNMSLVPGAASPADKYLYQLHALSLIDGQEKEHSPRTISAAYDAVRPDGTPLTRIWANYLQSQRTALTLANGTIYFGSASFADNGAYFGWVLGYNAVTLAQEVVYNTTPNGADSDGGEGGVWQSSQGLTVDDAGNLYFETGNGATDVDGGPNHGSSFIKLDGAADLHKQAADWFTPYNYEYLNLMDLDLGSSGLLLIPGTPLLVGGGKEGKLYVVDSGHMGNYEADSDSQIVQSFPAAASHRDNGMEYSNIHGSPVYWEGPQGKWIYLWGEEDYFKAFRFDGTKFDPTPASQSPFIAGNGMPGGFISISADGGKADTGIAWVNMPLTDNANVNTVEGVLRAFDAGNLSHELWNSKDFDSRDHLGNFAKFTAPTVSNGKVYMATFSGELVVYGLLSADAKLRSLTTSGGSPSQGDDPLHYKLKVDSNVDGIAVTPTANAEYGATVTVNGEEVKSGAGSELIPLNIGHNTISITVTAQDRLTVQSYVLDAVRGSANANLTALAFGGGVLNGAFSPTQLNYSADLPYATNAVSVSAATYDAAAKAVILLNGNPQPWIEPTIPLQVGVNTIQIQVTAQDEETRQTYTIAARRAAPSSNATLQNLTLANITLSPGVTSSVYHYQANVPYSVASTSLTAVLADPKASYAAKLNGAPMNGTAPLAFGFNFITLEVTAESGTKQVYTVTVVRDSGDNALLREVSLSGNTLDHSVTGAVYQYTATVPYEFNSTTVAAVTYDANAKFAVRLNGQPVSGPVPLIVGSNVFSIAVTSPNGKTNQTYTVTVIRTGDNKPPVWQPGTALQASGVTASQATLKWTAATDNAGVSGYKIYTVTGTVYTELKTLSNVLTDTLSNLAGDTPYTFALRAGDAAGNWSDYGPLISIRTETALLPGGKPGPASSPVFGGGGGGGAAPPPVKKDPPKLEAGVLTLQPDTDAAVSHETADDGQAVTKVAVDKDRLMEVIASNAAVSSIALDIPGKLPAVEAVFPASVLKELAAKWPNAGIRFSTDGIAYIVPLQALGDIAGVGELTVTIAKVAGKRYEDIKAAVEASRFKLLTEPVDITVKIDGKELTHFQDKYVNVRLQVVGAVSPYRSTAVWVDDDGRIKFVPSTFSGGSGIAQVAIYSPHNSIFAVVTGSRSFADLRGHWAQGDVEELASKWIVGGVADNVFAPDASITRVQFAALLARSLGLAEDAAPDRSFTDVKPTDWFAGVVGAAYRAGLIAGFEDGSFQPDATITREQMVSMIAKALKYGGKDAAADLSQLNRFDDGSAISDWAKESAAMALSANIIQGAGEHAFAAKDQATRAQAAAMIKRMLQYLQFMN